MKDGLTAIAILMLCVCVILTALPDYRKMDRKDEFWRGCMEMQSEKNRETWRKMLVCEHLWNKRI